MQKHVSMFRKFFSRSPSPVPPPKNAVAAPSEETVNAWRKQAQDDIRDAHRELTRTGISLDRWTQQAGLRPEDPGQGIRFIRVEVGTVELFLKTLASIDDALKAREWGQYRRPEVLADLTAVEVAAPAGYAYLSLRGPVIFDKTVIDGDTSFDVNEHDVKLTLRGACRFENGLRIHCDNLAALRVSIEAPGCDYNIRLSGGFSAAPAAPKLGLDAAGVVFNGRVEISSGLDITHLDLSGARCNERFSMTTCSIRGRLQFVGTEFLKDATFVYCDFQHPPNLHNAVFRRRMAFDGCDFTAASKLFGSSCRHEDIDAYRTLRTHFAKLRNSRMEGVFFALEQRAERVLVHEDLVDLSLSWCFDVLSGYGQSTTRIAGCFIGWNAMFALLYRLLFHDVLSAKSEPFRDWPALSFALQNAFNPLALFSEKNLVSVHSIACFMLALVQALGSLSILTVFILTIRTRFRRGGGGSES